jgi:hypothetical protein|eukprot:30302-Pelagococcus_subviridis.AAC.2
MRAEVRSARRVRELVREREEGARVAFEDVQRDVVVRVDRGVPALILHADGLRVRRSRWVR